MMRRIFPVVLGSLLLVLTLQAGEPFKVIVFSKTLLYRHASITNGIAMLKKLAQEQDFTVVATEESTAFTTQLSTCKVAVFLSTSGDVLNEEQQNVFKNFVENGGGFVAIHAAVAGKVATEGDWPWYSQASCAEFDNHKAIERATVRIEDCDNVSTAHLAREWARTDEWYNFVSTPRSRAHILASLDEKSFHGGTMGEDHPVVWCKRIGKGRLWYTALGHTEASYAEPEFIQHVWGGIQIAAGLKPARFEPGK